jgi:ERCC4-type nuclease
MTAIFDTREPDPHPWSPHLPDGWRKISGTLETGDIALAALPEGVVIERKTPSDLAGCIGKGRERFERELRRGRYVGRLIVVVEGDLRDVIEAAPGIKSAAVVGSLAAWTARYAPFVFAGGVKAAAEFSFRALAAQVRTIEREAKALREASETL